MASSRDGSAKAFLQKAGKLTSKYAGRAHEKVNRRIEYFAECQPTVRVFSSSSAPCSFPRGSVLLYTVHVPLFCQICVFIVAGQLMVHLVRSVILDAAKNGKSRRSKR